MAKQALMLWMKFCRRAFSQTNFEVEKIVLYFGLPWFSIVIRSITFAVLADCSTELRSGGPAVVLENFDCFFSLLRSVSCLDLT